MFSGSWGYLWEIDQVEFKAQPDGHLSRYCSSYLILTSQLANGHSNRVSFKQIVDSSAREEIEKEVNCLWRRQILHSENLKAALPPLPKQVEVSSHFSSLQFLTRFWGYRDLDKSIKFSSILTHPGPASALVAAGLMVSCRAQRSTKICCSI